MTSMPFLLDATVAGVTNRIRHVTVSEESIVTPAMVADWLTGKCAYVAIRLGTLVQLDDTDLDNVGEAARNIAERLAAADVLDAAFQPETGRKDQTPPGDVLRTAAEAELTALVASVDAMRLTTDADEVDGGVSGAEYPDANVTMTKRW